GGVKSGQPPSAAPTGPAVHGGNKVYKSGPLFLSSKGIGWTSWKKRWFILTQTSLVFYRSDPNVIPQKGSEANLTLGGIDLNSSGSVVAKEDKRLITVLFTDGRDGRAFTLKAETLEDLHEWKIALEEALLYAPSAALVVGQNGIFKNDQSNAADATSEKSKDRQTVKSMVIGRPILLALEDIDGTPSFLEKALRFIEEYGVNTEGILRQAADVEDVERRIQEYEKGKSEFSAEEDPHIIADCIKYVLRELPSPPVPASCCKALLEAYRSDRSMRVSATRTAICETFPEPNRRLLQRILIMMQTIASRKAVNRMSTSAVAACMAPLLLRPLLAGDCDIENDFDVGGDGSVQLLQAAAAANHAQAIVITLLEEYGNIFGDGAATHEPYTDSEETGSDSEEITDDDSFDDDEQDVSEYSGSDVDENAEHGPGSARSEAAEDHHSKMQISNSHRSESSPSEEDAALEGSKNLSSRQTKAPLVQNDSIENADHPTPDSNKLESQHDKSSDADVAEASFDEISSELMHRPARTLRRPIALGRTPAKKNLSMESIELPLEDDLEIRNVECGEADLENKILNEARIQFYTIAKSLLQETLENRKHDLYGRRAALEKDVAQLQVQLQKEMDLNAALVAACKTSKCHVSISSLVDDKMKSELEEIIRAETDVENLKKQADDLDFQLHERRAENSKIGHHSGDFNNQNVDCVQSKTKDKQPPAYNVVTNTSENPSKVKQAEAAGAQGSKSRNAPRDLESKDDVSKQTGASSNIAAEPGSNKQQPGSNMASRKTTAKGEVSSSTTSALSKLTNRLNFLKERRSQIATELQSMDK
ncbi:hypothetical protein M569_12687, partial [Genlisea aurea]